MTLTEQFATIAKEEAEKADNPFLSAAFEMEAEYFANKAKEDKKS